MKRLANYLKIFLVCCFLMSTMIVKNASAQILPGVFESCPISEEPFPTEFSIQQRWATPNEAGRRTLPYQTPIVGDLFGNGQPVAVVPADNGFNPGVSVGGRRVATLVDGQLAAGTHQVTFDASHLSSGVYLYALQAEGVILTRKLTLIK